MTRPEDSRPLPSNGPTEQTIRTLEDLHTEHYSGMSRLARLARWTKTLLAKPIWVGFVLCAVASWMAANSFGGPFGLRAFDPYPFPLLALIGTLFAVITTLLILATQSRDDKLAERRSQLTLQMATLCEQKIAKVIALIEEQRRDSPNLQSRHDPEADEMAAASDPKAVLTRISETHRTPGET